MNGSIVYCRFSCNDHQYHLSTELYPYYINNPPENLNIDIGTIFEPLNAVGGKIYKNTQLRCEAIIGVKDKTDAEFLEARELKEFKNIAIIKHSNLYKNKNKCSYDKINNTYKNNGFVYSAQEFWENIVKYKNDEIEQKKSSKIKNNKGEKAMEKKNVFRNILKNMSFGKIETDSIKYSFNGIAFQTNDGDYVVYNDDFTFTNVSDMVINIPVFAMPVAKKDINTGDVILHNGNYVIVKSVSNTEIKVARPWNREIVSIIPEKSIFGFSFYTKIMNPFDGFNMSANEEKPFGNIMPLLFLTDNKNNDNSINDMIMLMMLNGNMNNINPLFLYMMGNNENINPLLLFAMSGNNPFSSMVNINSLKEKSNLNDYVPDVNNEVKDVINKE